VRRAGLPLRCYPWFKKFDAHRHTITCKRNDVEFDLFKTHLNIAEEKMCLCGEDHESIDHVIWDCIRFQSGRQQLSSELAILGTTPLAPVRDMMGCQKFERTSCCLFFSYTL